MSRKVIGLVMSSQRTSSKLAVLVTCLCLAILWSTASVDASQKKKKKKQDAEVRPDPFAEIVFPPPPDTARIKLENILTGRADLESKGSSLKKVLIGSSPQLKADRLQKPIDVDFDSQGRIVVSDWESAVLVRFDTEQDVYDILGAKSTPALNRPMGVDITEDDTILVADIGLKQVVGFDPSGPVRVIYGRGSDLTNPTDVAISPDGLEIFVVDSRLHKILVFGAESGAQVRSIGSNGMGPGQFAYPMSLAFGPEGNIFVVDQMNSRVQMLDAEGEFIDEFGGLGTGFGSFVRPKYISVDEVGFIYVTDFAFNNFQIFDVDFSLLTFIGQGGLGPAQFQGPSGIAVQGDRIAVVDSLGKRVQVFRFLVPKIAE